MKPDPEERKRQAEYKQAIAEQQAEQARALLENPALGKAFQELTAAYMFAWKGTGPEDFDTREDAWLMVRALEQLEGHLKAKLAGGRIVSFNLRGALAAKQENS